MDIIQGDAGHMTNNSEDNKPHPSNLEAILGPLPLLHTASDRKLGELGLVTRGYDGDYTSTIDQIVG